MSIYSKIFNSIASRYDWASLEEAFGVLSVILSLSVTLILLRVAYVFIIRDSRADKLIDRSPIEHTAFALPFFLYSICNLIVIAFARGSTDIFVEIFFSVFVMICILVFLDIFRVVPLIANKTFRLYIEYGSSKLVFDLINNISIFFLLIGGVYTISVFGRAAIWILLFWHFVRILRFYIFARAVGYGAIQASSADSNQVLELFYRGVIEHGFRIIVFLGLGLGFSCLLLIPSSEILQRPYAPATFSNGNPSGLIVLDFVYFGIVTATTTGYGDISPISVGAKLITSLGIIFSYITLVSLIGLVVGVISSKIRVDSSRHI